MKTFVGAFAGFAVALGMTGMLEEVVQTIAHHDMHGNTGWFLAFEFGVMILGGLIGNAAER